MRKVLFICRFNRFRSQIAAGFFNKYCPKNIAVGKSAGLIRGQPISRELRKFAKVKKINLTQPKGLEREIVNNQDMFVIVADDVPHAVFSIYKKRGKQVRVWKIKDKSESSSKDFLQTIKLIEERVIKLVEELKKQS